MPPAGGVGGGGYAIMTPTQAPRALTLQDRGPPTPLGQARAPNPFEPARRPPSTGTPASACSARSDGSADSGALARAAAVRREAEAIASASPLIRLPGSTLTSPQAIKPSDGKPQGPTSPLGARSTSGATQLLSGSKPPNQRTPQSAKKTSQVSCLADDAFARWSVVPNTVVPRPASGHSSPALLHSLVIDSKSERTASHGKGGSATARMHRQHNSNESWDVGDCLGAVVEGEIFFFGPKLACSFQPETGCWQKLETRGRAPVITQGHTAAVARKSKRIVVTGPGAAHASLPGGASGWVSGDGGGDGGAQTKDASTHRGLSTQGGRRAHNFDEIDAFYVFDTSTLVWERHCAPGAGARTHHTANFVDGTRLYVVGGQLQEERSGLREEETLIPDVLVLDMQTGAASTPEMGGEVPPRRHSHGAATVGTVIYVFGGKIGAICIKDLLIIDANTNAWDYPKTSGTPPGARCLCVCKALSKSRVCVMGGKDHFGDVLDDVYVLDTGSMAWSRPGLFGESPLPCAGQRIVVSGFREKEAYFVWGGEGLEADMKDGRLFCLEVTAEETGEEGGLKRSGVAAKGVVDVSVDTRQHISHWEKWIWRVDELTSKLSAIVRREAEAIADPRDYAHNVLAAVQELRREAAELLGQTSNIVLLCEVDIDKLLREHEKEDDTREKIALRRAQILEACASHRQRAMDAREQEILSMCTQMINDSLDSERHLAVEELLWSLAEYQELDMPGNVVYCHRHGSRKPTHGVDSSMSPPDSPMNQSGLLSRASSVRRLVPSKFSGYAAMPPTSEKADKWGTGVYAYENQLLTHSKIEIGKVRVVPPSRGENYLPGDETGMTHMEIMAKRLGLSGDDSVKAKFKIWTHAAASLRDMPSRRSKVVGCDVLSEWRTNCEQMEKAQVERDRSEQATQRRLQALKERVVKLEADNIRLAVAEQRACDASTKAQARLRDSEEEATRRKEKHRAGMIKRWGFFMRRLSVRLWMTTATKYLVTKQNPKELQDFQSKVGGKRNSVKSLLKENDELKLRVAKAGEMKKEIAVLGHQLEQMQEALHEVSESLSAAQHGQLRDDMNEALLDIQSKTEKISKALQDQNLPEAGFTEHLSHRLSTEKNKSRVCEQTIKNLTKQMQIATNERLALRLRAEGLEASLQKEKDKTVESLRHASEKDQAISRLQAEIQRLESRPTTEQTDGGLEDALKTRDDRVQALERALAAQRQRGQELEARLRKNEEERSDLQEAFMMVFEHERETSPGFEEWLSRFPSKHWFAWAQVQARQARDERDHSVENLGRVRSPRVRSP